MWKHLVHPNIVPVRGITTEPFQLVSDWVPGWNLTEFVKERPNGYGSLGLVGIPSTLVLDDAFTPLRAI